MVGDKSEAFFHAGANAEPSPSTLSSSPQANASYTFTSWMRLGLGAGYRLIGAASGLESHFRGATASLPLQFGKFY